jgi:hypothetical protein
MCHHCHVSLSEEDAKDARKLSGLMIPVYASIVLAVVALVAFTGVAPRGDLVAQTAAPAAPAAIR